MNYDKQINRIIDYIKSGEKKESQFTIGSEFENFIIDTKTLKTIPYYGDTGVGKTILKLSTILNAKPIYDKDCILGFESENYSVSTEPGSQFEISINSQKNINSIDKYYVEFMNILIPLLKDKKQSIVSLGYHPKTKIDEIKILPKERYAHMFNYFKNKGSMAHNMMKGTASVQATIDFESESDFIKKYFLSSAISPILYTIFDNSYIFESIPYDGNNLREKIWENTDKDRSGVLPIAFDKDLSYKKYAEFILNTPPIFMPDGSSVIYTANTTFRELFNPVTDSDELIFHAMSIVFPDVRLKKYLEFRMIDGLKYPLNFSAIALIKGLFYNAENLNILYKKYKNVTYSDVMSAKSSSENLGLSGKFMGEDIYEHEKFLLNLAVKGLEENEKKYLNPIIELCNKKLRPKDEFEKLYKKYGLEKAVENNIIEVSNVQQ